MALSILEKLEILDQIDESYNKLDSEENLSVLDKLEVLDGIDSLYTKLDVGVEGTGRPDTTETDTTPAFVAVLNKVIAGEFDTLGAAGAFAKITEVNMEVENSPYESLGCQALDHVKVLAVAEKEGYRKAAA